MFLYVHKPTSLLYGLNLQIEYRIESIKKRIAADNALPMSRPPYIMSILFQISICASREKSNKIHKKMIADTKNLYTIGVLN